MLTEEDWKNIHEISENRYQKWEWNFGKSPKSNVQHMKKFDGGLLEVRLDVHKGIIENCKIYGDFFCIGLIHELEDKLKGVRYDRDAITEATADVEISHYLGKITKEEFLQLVY